MTFLCNLQSTKNGATLSNMLALENYTFTIAVLNTSFFRLYKLEDGTIVGREGRDFLVLQTLSLLLGFSYRLVIPADKQYGVPGKDGSWNGLIGMLARDEVDMTATTIAYSVERNKAVNFSFVCKRDKFMYISKSTRVDHNYRSDYFFLNPFNKKVWLLLGVFTLLFTFFLPWLGCCLPPNCRKIIREFSFWTVTGLITGLIHQKRFWTFDARSLGAVAIAILLACSFKIYGSFLSSAVNVSEGGSPIDTIQDLADAVRFQNMSVGLLKGHDIIQIILKNSMREDLQVLAKYLEGTGKRGQKTFPDAIQDILETNYVLIVGVQTFIKLMHEHRFSLRKVHIPNEPLLVNSKAMAYATAFQFNNLFNRMIRRIMTYGLMEKWEALENFKMERDLSETESVRSVIYINMMDLDHVFRSLVAVQFFASLVLLAEKAFHKYFYPDSKPGNNDISRAKKSRQAFRAKEECAKLKCDATCNFKRCVKKGFVVTKIQIK